MSISHRAKKIIDSPQYGTILKDMPQNFYQWKFTCDKKLTVSYETSFDFVRIPLLEVIALMLNQKNMSNLFTLDQREVESFLRDQNDLPAFPEYSIGKIYDQAMIDLAFSFFRYQQQTYLLSSTFIEENRFWMKLFESLEGVEFIIKEKNSLNFFNKRSDMVVSFTISE